MEYHKPANLDEALQLLRRPQVRTVPLGGGTALVPGAAHDVQAVVDLSALDLAYVKVDREITIGATTTLQQIVEATALRDYAGGVLVKAALDSASRNTRDAATLAGSIVAAGSNPVGFIQDSRRSPQGNSPLLTTLLALKARLTVRGDRAEEIDLSQWSHQDRTLILKVTLPTLDQAVQAAYEKVARTPADLPIVCVAARATAKAGRLSDVRLALGGVGDKPLLIERASLTIEQAVQLAAKSIDPPSDYFASADYRREMIGVLVRRVLTSLSG
jgi:CO/xanthine dehydrogenase FAD-binding subunit